MGVCQYFVSTFVMLFVSLPPPWTLWGRTQWAQMPYILELAKHTDTTAYYEVSKADQAVEPWWCAIQHALSSTQYQVNTAPVSPMLIRYYYVIKTACWKMYPSHESKNV